MSGVQRSLRLLLLLLRVIDSKSRGVAKQAGGVEMRAAAAAAAQVVQRADRARQVRANVSVVVEQGLRSGEQRATAEVRIRIAAGCFQEIVLVERARPVFSADARVLLAGVGVKRQRLLLLLLLVEAVDESSRLRVPGDL